MVIGLSLIAAGFWWLPELQIRSGALFVPGGVCLWVSVPMRAPFVKRQPMKVMRKERT